MIRVHVRRKAFGGREVLRDVRLDLDPGDPLGGGDRLPHRGDGALEVHNNPFAEAVGGNGALTDNVKDAVTRDLADDGADFRSADV